MMLKALSACGPPSRAACSAASTSRSLAANRPSVRPQWVPRSVPEDASTSMDTASQSEAAGGESLDEKERARRQKISQANTGRTPWNKGKRHSQETIAKIRERTIEAMARTEIVEKVKAGLAARHQVHSPETRAKISAKVRANLEAKREAKERRIAEGLEEPEEPKKSRRRKDTPASSSQGAEAHAPVPVEPTEVTASSSQGDGPLQGSRSAPRAKGRRAPPGGPTAPEASEEGPSTSNPSMASRKNRSSNSQQHKQNIAEAIRRKWEDPEYREYMCQKMREAAAKRLGRDPDEAASAPRRPSRSRSKPGSSGSSAGSSGSISTSASTSTSSSRGRSSGWDNRLANERASKAKQQEWLQQVQAMVDQLLASKKLLSSMDQKIEEMKAQASDAFVNDEFMSSRLEELLWQVEDRRRELAEGVAAQEAKIPASVGFDLRGRVFLLDAAGPGQTTQSSRTAGASDEGQQGGGPRSAPSGSRPSAASRPAAYGAAASRAAQEPYGVASGADVRPSRSRLRGLNGQVDGWGSRPTNDSVEVLTRTASPRAQH